jgi:hypothetical protein
MEIAVMSLLLLLLHAPLVFSIELFFIEID